MAMTWSTPLAHIKAPSIAHLCVFKCDIGVDQLCSAAPCIILWVLYLWEDSQVSLHEGEQDIWIP